MSDIFIQSNNTGDRASLSEHELWIALKENNRKAFSELYLRFYEQLFRYGMSISGSESAVKDGIQNLFLRLWKKRKTLAVVKCVKGYLFVSLRRILFRDIKQSQSRSQRANEFKKRNFQKNTSVEEKIITQEEYDEQQHQFHKAINLLTPRQKEALTLRLECGFSNTEIAAIMDVSEKRIRNLFYEAIKKLKEAVHIPSK